MDVRLFVCAADAWGVRGVYCVYCIGLCLWMGGGEVRGLRIGTWK